MAPLTVILEGVRWSPLAWLLVVVLAGCATAPDASESKPRVRRRLTVDAGPPADAATADVSPDGDARSRGGVQPAAETWGGMEFQEVNEKRWLADVRIKVAERMKVDPAQLVISPGKLHVALVRGPAETEAPRRRGPPRPRRFQIIVVDNQGRSPVTFRPVTIKGSDEPPKDLRFLSEERLVYEVVAPPAPPPPAAPTKAIAKSVAAKPAAKRLSPPRTARTARRPSRGKPAAAAAPAPPPAGSLAGKPTPSPTRLFIIQPLEGSTRPIRCEGRHFAFAAGGDHLAFVGGPPDAGYVAVDGQPMYPRRGRTGIASPVAWSKDGRSLAFLESPAAGPARLVLLAEFDNATGDTTWELPPAASVEGARVFFAGTGRLVVGKTLTHPIFSASFQKM